MPKLARGLFDGWVESEHIQFTLLVELLHELIEGIEHHYAQQVHRYHNRQREIRQDRRYRQSPLSTPTDPPF